MKKDLRLKLDDTEERKISFNGSFLVCVRIPLFCRTTGNRREVKCDFSRLADPKERQDNLVLFSRN